jgi:hypothetical protein
MIGSARTNGAGRGVVENEHWDYVDAMFAKYENLNPDEKRRIVGASVPFGRKARRNEIGGLATFLASETLVTSSRRPTISMAATG